MADVIADAVAAGAVIIEVTKEKFLDAEPGSWEERHMDEELLANADIPEEAAEHLEGFYVHHEDEDDVDAVLGPYEDELHAAQAFLNV